jgi:hypothetical protein
VWLYLGLKFPAQFATIDQFRQKFHLNMLDTESNNLNAVAMHELVSAAAYWPYLRVILSHRQFYLFCFVMTQFLTSNHQFEA